MISMTWKNVGLLALLLGVGAGGVAVAVAKQKGRGPEVRTEEVGRRDLVSVVTASGYVQPRRKVDISADISGRVREVLVEEGQWVDRGALLLRIDPTSFEANVRRATATVSQARAQAAQARASVIRSESEVARAEQLAHTNNLISISELEQVRTQLLVAEAQLEAAQFGVEQAEAGLSEARVQLGKTTISAPMSGQVTRLNIQAGETAIVGTMNNPGSLLLTIADLSEMEARVRVGETDIPAIAQGDSARIRIDAYPNQVFTGRVTRISNSAVNAPSTRTSGSTGAQQQQAIDFEVIVALDQPPADLRPDLTATAEIVVATRTNVLTVPIISVTVRDAAGKRFRAEDGPEARGRGQDREVEGVFVLRDGRAEWVPVQIGIAGDWYFEVLGGLGGGESIVSGPYSAVRDLEAGTEVRRMEEAEARETREDR
jgi:HlyD family secretion protein